MKIQEILQMVAIIGVGPPRSGTTWLDEILRTHPEIQMPRNVKELRFFSEKFEKGITWYASHYIPIDPGIKVWGDISPAYLTYPDCPQRIKGLLPNAKIIIGLRNPYDRVISMYGLHLMYGRKNIGLNKAIQSLECFIQDNIISEHIKKYCNLFDKENIFFMLYDELATCANELARKIYRFIGVDDTFTNMMFNKRVHSSVLPRNRMLAKLAFSIQKTLRYRFEFHYIANKVKQSTIIWKLLFYSNRALLKIKSEDKAKAFQYLSSSLDNDIDCLEKITGKSLRHWKYQP